MSEQCRAMFSILCSQQYSQIHSRRQLRYFTKATRKALLHLGCQKWPLCYIRGNLGCFPPLFFFLRCLDSSTLVLFQKDFEILAPVVALALETFHSPLAALSALATTQNQRKRGRDEEDANRVRETVHIAVR